MKYLVYQGVKGNKKRVCAHESIFDAIVSAHAKCGHKATRSTKSLIDVIYSNITQTCLELCPVYAKQV